MATPEVNRRGTIVVVEDQCQIRELICEILRDHGYTVLEAADGLEAFEMLTSHTGTVDLLLTDWWMPRMDGSELCRRLSWIHPETRVLVMSGSLDGEPRADIAFLQKPFTLPRLIRVVDELLCPCEA
jgi:two-component system, cell cycle sensor histidine kinase and response regulator CckA